MNRLRITALASALCFATVVCAVGAFAGEDIPIETFEAQDNTLSSWQQDGTVFAPAPRNGPGGRLNVSGIVGEAFFTSLSPTDEDEPIGRAQSPDFTIQRKFIRFLIAGGRFPGRTCLNLVVDDKVVRSATGHNGAVFKLAVFDTSEFIGKTARVELVDQERRPWGHVSVDHIIQTDTADTSRIIRTSQAGLPDVVDLHDGRHQGHVRLQDNQLTVDGRPLPLEKVNFIVKPARNQIRPQPHTIRLVGGELWRVTIESLLKDKLTVSGGLFQQRVIDVAAVASLDFAPGTNPYPAMKPGVLYRTTGRPIPGTVLWIKEKNVAIDCPLGIIPLPRAGLTQYAFTDRPAESPQAAVDQISLFDGSILRGRVRFEEGKVVLDHPILETIELRWDDVRYLLRADRGITWLADLDRTKLQRLGPLGPPPEPRAVEPGRIEDAFLSSFRVHPKTVAGYRLPSDGGGSRVLRAVLAPSKGCRGDLSVSLEMSGRSLFRCDFSPSDAPRRLSIDLPAGDELLVRVDFGSGLAYPCAVDFQDAYVALSRARREGSDK